MVNSLKQMTLSTAIGLALVGAGLQSSVVAQAAAPQIAASAGVIQTSDDGVYIITFDEAGLLHYNGSVNGIMATAPRANNKLDMKSASAQAYQSYLVSQRSAHVSDIDFAIGRSLVATHYYSITQNGIAAQLSASEAAKVADLPGVKNVRKAGVEHIGTYRGPEFIGADTIWSGANTPSTIGTRGEGITVGVLDTGANSTHPSFANDTSCGFRPSKPKLIAVDCSVTDVNGFCAGPDPEADQGNGHGVHTASTVGGNTIDNTATPAPLLPDGVSMSGVAPCAAIVSYKVCQTTNCGGADIQAGIENAIADGVDVINYSISGGSSPWSDTDRLFLDAVDADILVAASAGNTSTATPDPVGAVNHLGPWVMTVAASTQDELIGPELAVTGPDPLPPSPDLAHVSLNPGTTTIVGTTVDSVGKAMLSYPTNIVGCTSTGAFPTNYFNDAIALIRRGSCSFTEKVTNAFNAGAIMVVVGNNVAGGLNMDTTGAPDVPNFGVSQEDGDALIAYAAGNNPPPPPADQIFADGFETAQPFGALADYNRSVSSSRQGDVLADFSFRGPTPGAYASETKPDITGPGVDIFAALTTDEGSYGLLSGTSMSAPHLAGAGALMRAVHPDWSVVEVKSAMMMTSTNATGVQEDTTTPWNIDDVGAGRIDLSKAALAGLTMDETYANFLAADPAASGDIKTLNLPHLRNVVCEPDCTWTREFKNQLPVAGTWDVSFVTDAGFTMTATPATFTLAPGATQSVVFKATLVSLTTTLAFGEAILTEQAAMSPDQHLTIAVKTQPPTIAVAPSSLSSSQLTDTMANVPLTVSNVGGGTLAWTYSAAGVINGTVWDQPKESTGGIVSTFSVADDGGGFTAADFQVTGVASSEIRKLTVFGFDNVAQLLLQPTITWSIYSDASGMPSGNPDTGAGSAPVWTADLAPTATGVTITGTGDIVLDLAAAGQSLSLPAGTYWLNVYATYTATIGGTGAARWNWSQGVQKAGPALLTGNAFGVADWTALTDLGVTWPDVAFSIEGDVPCGASWLSVSPMGASNAAGTSTAVTATFDSTGLANGSYSATACFASNDAANPLLTVPVTLQVGPVGPPQPVQDPSFEATTSGGGSNPSWDSVDGNAGAGGGTVLYGTNPRNGTFAVWFGGWVGGAETQYVSQSVTFPAAGPAFLNYWRFADDLPDAAGTLTVSVDGIAVQTTDLSAITADSGYVQQSIDVSTYADGSGHVIKFEFVYPDADGNGVDGSTFLDDVSVDPTSVSTLSANGAPAQFIPGMRKNQL